MKTSRLSYLWATAGFVVAANLVTASVAKMESLGDNTYACTREASTSFDRNVDKLAAEAKDDAAQYCAKNGREPKVLAITVRKAWPTLGFSKATVTFKALAPGDPGLADQTPVVVSEEHARKQKPAGAGAVEGPVDELYNGLMKLDELRRRGLLTDEEFQAEKKRLLERSK
ncbi:MAG TPA: SHOCT domain-containing protein [Opitutus sp.]|nr:SHOCT domain-containing protein [Opitutus sp.]